MILPYKLSYGDYFFVYDASDNIFFGLIHPTPDSADTPEAYMIYKDVVDTMVDDMLEAMERKMAISVMTPILSVGRNMKLMITLTLCQMNLNKIPEIIYIYVSPNQQMSQNLL